VFLQAHEEKGDILPNYKPEFMFWNPIIWKSEMEEQTGIAEE